MLRKTRQFRDRWKYTSSNRLTVLRARQFLNNCLRQNKNVYHPRSIQNLASSRILWRRSSTYFGEHRVAIRTKCILTGRNRSVSARFNVSRIQLKALSSEGQLFGLRKSSW